MKKEPLYRKVNTKALRVEHNFGGDFRHSRNRKKETREQSRGTMSARKDRGLDYTPLYRFLLSKAGKSWDEVFSEAKARLDKTDPVFVVVALEEGERQDYVRVGESSYFSGMYVDEDGLLQLTAPDLSAAQLTPSCQCCTHTLNGKVFGTE